MKLKKLTIIFISIITIAFLTIFGLEWWNTNKSIVSTDNAYVRSSITTMSSRVSSYILEVPAHTNAIVKQNDLLVVLDPEPYKNKVDSVNASLEAAKAKIEAAKAKIEAAKTKITTIESSYKNINANIKLVKSEINSYNFIAQSYSSELELAEKNLARIEKLYEKNSISRAKLDETLAKVKTTSHRLDSANSKTNSIKNQLEVLATEKEKVNSLQNELMVEVRKSEAELKIAQADYEQSKAELNMAKVDLESTKIYAPIDGIVANRIAEPGLYVEDGWPLMAIVPVHDIWVIANYKETQVENIKVGQKAKLHFDAFKNNPIIGEVHSISPASSASFSLLPPQNASGNFVKVVQRVPVKITFKIPEKMLGRIVPGLSVYASIETKE